MSNRDALMAALACFGLAALLLLIIILAGCSAQTTTIKRPDNWPSPDVTIMEACEWQRQAELYHCQGAGLEQGLHEIADLWRVCASEHAHLKHCLAEDKADDVELSAERHRVDELELQRWLWGLGGLGLGASMTAMLLAAWAL